MLIPPMAGFRLLWFSGGCGFPGERALRVPSNERRDDQARNGRVFLREQQEVQRRSFHGG